MPSQVEHLAELGRTELMAAWEGCFGAPPPPSTSQDMMRLIVGWHIQAKHARSDVRELKSAVGKVMRQGHKTKAGGDSSPAPVKSRITISPGTRLSREWQGRTYSVDVVDKGYAYDGTLFTSLSPIAKAITGSHRSGPHFFGVSK